jgi:hypothetical protein
MTPPVPSTGTGWLAPHAALLLASFERLLGRSLLVGAAGGGSPPARARALYEAPFVVLSHGRGRDPAFGRFLDAGGSP